MSHTLKKRGKSPANLVVAVDDDSAVLGEVLHRSTKTSKSSKKAKNSDKLLKPSQINNPDSDFELGTLVSDQNSSAYRSKCSCDSHFDKVFLDSNYNIIADKMFDLIFGANEFVRTYRQAQRIYEDTATEWYTSAKDNCEERMLNYKVPYESTFVGRGTITTRERQTILKKEAGSYYQVETELFNSGVRYSDTFSLVMRYCILQTSGTTTHLLITAQVRFCKQVLGFIKQLIERNAFTASIEGFKDMNNRLNLISKFKKGKYFQTFVFCCCRNLLCLFEEKRLLTRDGVTLPVPVVNNKRARRTSRHDTLGIKSSDPLINNADKGILNHLTLSIISHANPILCFLMFIVVFLVMIQLYLYLKLRYMDILVDSLSNLMKMSSSSSSKRRA
ncbi:unnamed protein product [Rotaria socialis]|uniref:VASt domain-containing protein n=1 Tax=Rotaria socialis TaxID=392032 RepID=A0A821TIT4_9BILA|nr:unnamed protein product [Rotaria socialis]CAF4422923.1 unnamed protein product [Rotaria socialis]CAF4551889.1 unnamed protein product [Rotaria socialis]CAF4560998.1 unnamed protein product [Rotaria socialis]CAF4875365.1 unnamed protein product [Rotaria socialis]